MIMALSANDLVVVQEVQTGEKKLLKSTVSNFFTKSAELTGIDCGAHQIDANNWDYEPPGP